MRGFIFPDRGGVLYGKTKAICRPLEVAKKFHMGVYRPGNRTLTAVQGPTKINCQNAQKSPR